MTIKVTANITDADVLDRAVRRIAAKARRTTSIERTIENEDKLQRLRKKLPHDYEELDDLDVSDLRDKIVECQTNLVEQQREMETDEVYQTAKAEFQKRAEPYKDAKARLNAIMTYCTLAIEQKGG